MSDLQLALQITLVGMGLVFGAIILLWGLMYLLTALIHDRDTSPAAGEPPVPTTDSSERDALSARAAAAAVALAIAEQEASSAHPLPAPPTAIVSAWQLGMRSRQMYQKGNPYRKEQR